MMPTLCAISMALPSVYMVLLLAISAMVISDVRFADVFLLNAFLSPCPKGEGITLSLPGSYKGYEDFEGIYVCLLGKRKGQNTCHPGMDWFGNSIFRLQRALLVLRSDQDATEK